MTFEEAVEMIREKRQIANPNGGFLVQLKWFYRRLYDPEFNCLPVYPRVYLVSSHQPEDPFKITCRMLMKNLF